PHSTLIPYTTLFRSNQVTWINVNGLNNTSIIEKLGTHYGLHPLTLEDIVNTNHRPKMDEFETYLFIVLKMLYIKNDEELVFEQRSEEHTSELQSREN